MKLEKDQIQSIVLIVIVYVVIFVVADTFFFKKIKGEIKSLKSNNVSMRSIMQQNQIKITSIEQIREQYKKENEKYNEKKSLFIKEIDKKILLNQIEELGKKYNIKFSTINLMVQDAAKKEADTSSTLSQSGTDEMPTYKEFLITMNIKSNYENLVSFVEELEKMKKMVVVEKLDIRSEDYQTTNELSVNLVVKSFIFEDKGANSDG